MLTSQSPLRMLRSHSQYCSGLHQRLLAIVNLVCKFLALFCSCFKKPLLPLYGSCPPKIYHSDCSKHLKGKIGSKFHASTQGGPSHKFWAFGVLLQVRAEVQDLALASMAYSVAMMLPKIRYVHQRLGQAHVWLASKKRKGHSGKRELISPRSVPWPEPERLI